ncbi:hypothetical protein [Saccharobesus litoralis]|uniref:hypothetical protein n=1 Tax=Saccharobesus litoralis TaxID=2172099 RepID=UPI00131EF851|nr:hypothetical protein [Saccharobesus litoralis]
MKTKLKVLSLVISAALLNACGTTSDASATKVGSSAPQAKAESTQPKVKPVDEKYIWI